MVHSIEVFLQPPSPKQTKEFKLPPINTFYSLQERLPNVYLTDQCNKNNILFDAKENLKLNILEPNPCLSAANSPILNPSSPHLAMSSPSSSSISPLISPITDYSLLLAPPSKSFRRCRSVSNGSLSSSPLSSYRSLSEPPAFDSLPPCIKPEKEKTNHPLFGPKRKRGRPPNTSRPESNTESFSNWTFIKPTVWDVKNKGFDQRNKRHRENNNVEISSSIALDCISNTFTNTSMTQCIPKKKRGRKPKKQLAGNSCFVWKDLTAPRGANKKKIIQSNQQILPILSCQND